MKEIKDSVLFVFIWILAISLQECRADQMCTIFEFKCNNQKCIHKSWLCDKANDCDDGSDEKNCSGKVPGKPAQVVVTVLNATSLRISWNPHEDKKVVEPVLFHVLTFRNTLSVQEQEIKVPGFQNSVSLYHLKMAGNFIFSIFAVNVVGRGMKSDDVMVKLKRQIKASSSLQAKAVNESSIKLYWSNFGDVNILGYFLQYRDVNGENKNNELLQKINTISLQGTITEYEVHKNIQPSTIYRFTLQPFSKFGYEQVIGPVFVKTPERAPKPLDFKVFLSGSGLKPFAALEVTSQDANAKAYILRYGKSLRKSLPIREETVRLLPGNYRNEEIPIQPFFWYYFTLSKQANDGIWSREKSAWLRGPISGFTASSTADVVTLIWSRIDPEDNGDHHTVLFKAQNETHRETRLSVRSNFKRGFNLLNVANLRPGTLYDFTIKRQNSVCQNNACLKITVKTKNEAKISSKRCDTPCPKILAPICASDGNSYDNICQMKNAACLKNKEITFKHVGYCCYITCSKEGSSVCASDGNTYASACLVKQAACLLQKEITVKHLGSCCYQDCPKVDAPVCGSDSNSYDNICEMQKASCLSGIAISAKHFGNCCDKKCPITQHPVCADDGQTYASICLMENVACKLKKRITINYRGKCHSNETCPEECKFYSKCQTSEDGTRSCRCDMECPKVASPVCGSDGNSYYNLCTMKKTSCLKKIMITVANNGMCVDMCKRSEFKCKNNECILRSWICDGQPDCRDNSDEHPDLCDEEA